MESIFDTAIQVADSIRNLVPLSPSIDHFTVVSLVAWLLNEREAEIDLALIETSLLFLYKFLLISMRIAYLT